MRCSKQTANVHNIRNFHLFTTHFSVLYPEVFWSRYSGLRSQTLKSVKTNSSKNRQMPVHTNLTMYSFCIKLFRMQNNQNFPGLRPWTPMGRAYSVPLQTPCHTTKNFLDTALSLQLRQRWMIKQTKSAIRCPSKSVKYMKKLFS